MPTNGFHHRIVIPVPRQRVWAELQDSETWKALVGLQEIFDVTHDERGHLRGYRWIAAAGPRHIEGVATVAKSREPTSMVLNVDAGEYTGEIDARLREAPRDSTAIAVAMLLEAHGVMASLFFPAVSKVVGDGLPRQLEVFGDRLVQGA